MPKVSPIQNSFNGGELSPRLVGRTDFDKYRSGCYKIENFMPLVQGPAERRPGTRFVTSVKIPADRTWMVPFSFNTEQSYAIELGNQYARFFTQRAQLLSAPFTPYEIFSPYVVTDLTNSDGSFRPAFVQSNDIMFWANAGYFPYMLERKAATNWAFRTYGLDPAIAWQARQIAFQFPYRSFSSDPNTKIYVSGVTGAINVTAATGAPFAAWMVGLNMLLQSDHGSGVLAWEPGKVVAAGSYRRVDSRVYFTGPGGTTGSVRPTHTEGARNDGDPGVQWTFMHAGFGVAVITGFVDAAHLTAAVVTPELPGDIVGLGNATSRYAVQAWNANDGYPTWVGFFRERLVWTRGSQIWMSQPGDFTNHAEFDANGDVTDESAISVTLPSPAAIRWGEETEQGLFLSTDDGEWVVSEINPNDPLAATNIRPKRQSRYGSAPMVGTHIGDAILFPQRGGRKLREAIYTFENDSFKSRNLTVLSDHVLQAGLIDMAFQQEPHSILWCVTGDGALVALTYDREQEVYCWHPHQIGGIDVRVESVCTIPAPDGTQDDLWLIVQRTALGASQRHVEYLRPVFADGEDIREAWFLDCALDYTGPFPVPMVTGIYHLAGEEVYALADGSVQGPLTVSAVGEVALTTEASRVIVGLLYRSVIITERRDEGAADGTAQGKTKRIHKLFVRLHNTVGGKVGPNENELDPIPMRDSAAPMNGPVPPFTGDVEMPYPAGNEKDARICVVQDQPLPMTLVALMPRMVEQD